MAAPAARLKALTPEAGAAPGGTCRETAAFTFRVGRADRLCNGTVVPSERRRTDSIPNKGLYLCECGGASDVSREHFLIDRRQRSYVILDRGGPAVHWSKESVWAAGAPADGGVWRTMMS